MIVECKDLICQGCQGRESSCCRMAEFVQSLNTLQKDASIRKWIDGFIDTITANASFCLDHNHLYEYAYVPNNQESFQLKCKKCVVEEKLSGANLMLMEDYLVKNEDAINIKFAQLKNEIREPTQQDSDDFMNKLEYRIKEVQNNQYEQQKQTMITDKEIKVQRQLEQLKLNYEQRLIAMSAQTPDNHKHLHDDYVERRQKLREIIIKQLQQSDVPQQNEQNVYQLQKLNQEFFDNIHANI